MSDHPSRTHRLQTSRTPWPEHRIARGFLTVRATPNKNDKGCLTLCSIERSLLTLTAESPDGKGFVAEMAKVTTNEIVVTLFPGCFDMFCMTTVHEGIDIYCFAEDQVKRNKWVAVFRRMGIVVQGAKKSLHAHSSGTCPHDQSRCPPKSNNNNDATEGSNKSLHCVDDITLMCSDEDDILKYSSAGSEGIDNRSASGWHRSLARKQPATIQVPQGWS
jgi:hypothetical protein